MHLNHGINFFHTTKLTKKLSKITFLFRILFGFLGLGGLSETNFGTLFFKNFVDKKNTGTFALSDRPEFQNLNILSTF